MFCQIRVSISRLEQDRFLIPNLRFFLIFFELPLSWREDFMTFSKYYQKSFFQNFPYLYQTREHFANMLVKINYLITLIPNYTNYNIDYFREYTRHPQPLCLNHGQPYNAQSFKVYIFIKRIIFYRHYFNLAAVT